MQLLMEERSHLLPGRLIQLQRLFLRGCVQLDFAVLFRAEHRLHGHVEHTSEHQRQFVHGLTLAFANPAPVEQELEEF